MASQSLAGVCKLQLAGPYAYKMYNTAGRSRIKLARNCMGMGNPQRVTGTGTAGYGRSVAILCLGTFTARARGACRVDSRWGVSGIRAAKSFAACSSVLLPPLAPYYHHSCPTTTTRAVHCILPSISFFLSRPSFHSSGALQCPPHMSEPRVCAKHWWLLGSGGGGYTRHGYTPAPAPVPVSTGTYPWRVRVRVGLETPAGLPVRIPSLDSTVVESRIKLARTQC
ncbi:uncharacterized protein HD556DRAFT_1306142 [Suillus plorans]|uniref:Uncharacterized protein n=1 Tax=Suillus plorans TaxID=116603 RepID=A0A9P7J0E1_9AGAM|nr:uncharacterized protein HD556DRAFT_1306142 [Suillus plorans]KAG1798090.1 hypothetical protein HD556DRAFT_1306142 [Suillus plorans]